MRKRLMREHAEYKLQNVAHESLPEEESLGPKTWIVKKNRFMEGRPGERAFYVGGSVSTKVLRREGAQTVEEMGSQYGWNKGRWGKRLVGTL